MRDAIVDPNRVGRSVRAQGGRDLDVAQALAMSTWLRMVGPPREGVDRRELPVPPPLDAWAAGDPRKPYLDHADWRDVHGWPGEGD